MDFIPHSRPTIGKQEAEAVTEVLLSGMIAQGRKVAQFEEAFAKRVESAFAAAVSSGSSGLHLALLALGVGPGDEVLIPSFVCTALLNAVWHTGARPVVADIDPCTLNIDPQDALDRITADTRAIIVPHMFGLPADLTPLIETGIPIIEDCAQAMGARLGGRPVGSSGVLAVYSFYATKVMTTGEGGMVACQDARIIEKIKYLREYDNSAGFQPRFNYKMTDMQAAMGMVQLDKLDTFLSRRKALATRYRDALKEKFIKNITLPPDRSAHIYFRYVIHVREDIETLRAFLHKKGIGCERPVFKPIHHYLGSKDYPKCEKAWRESLSLPIYPGLSDEDFDRVVSVVKEVLS